MERVLKLVGSVGAAWIVASSSPVAAAQGWAGIGGGDRLAARAAEAGQCVARPVGAPERLDWCQAGSAGPGVRRAEDGGERHDDDRDERGNGDTHGGAYDDGGRHTDDHGGQSPGAERWERVDWGDVRFRLSGTVLGRELSGSQLESLLGRGVVSRMTKHAYAQRVEGELVGRWLKENPRVLRVYGGRVPVAEFTDRDGDERVDLVRLAYWR